MQKRFGLSMGYPGIQVTIKTYLKEKWFQKSVPKADLKNIRIFFDLGWTFFRIRSRNLCQSQAGAI